MQSPHICYFQSLETQLTCAHQLPRIPRLADFHASTLMDAAQSLVPPRVWARMVSADHGTLQMPITDAKVQAGNTKESMEILAALQLINMGIKPQFNRMQTDMEYTTTYLGGVSCNALDAKMVTCPLL